MSKNGIEPKDRLKELMQKKHITQKQLADLCSTSESTIRKYKSGENNIPVEIATIIANEYGVTLDWLYCRSEYMNVNDIEANILLAFEKIFRFTVKKDVQGYTYPVLLIDKKFYKYISDLDKLRQLHDLSDVTSDTYKTARKEIHMKYKSLFNELFDRDDFDEDIAIQIKDYEGLTILDILSCAVDEKEKANVEK